MLFFGYPGIYLSLSGFREPLRGDFAFDPGFFEGAFFEAVCFVVGFLAVVMAADFTFFAGRESVGCASDAPAA